MSDDDDEDTGVGREAQLPLPDPESWGDAVESVAEAWTTIRRLTADITYLSAVAEDLVGPEGKVLRIDETVDDLASTVRELSERLEELTVTKHRLTVPCLEHLEPGPWAEAVRQVGEWVQTVLVPTYLTARSLRADLSPRGLPEGLSACWFRHPAVVAELAWLQVAWAAAYRVPGRRWQDAADFHDRWLPGALGRIRVILAMCSDRHEASSVIMASQHPAGADTAVRALRTFLREVERAPAGVGP